LLALGAAWRLRLVLPECRGDGGLGQLLVTVEALFRGGLLAVSAFTGHVPKCALFIIQKTLFPRLNNLFYKYNKFSRKLALRDDAAWPILVFRFMDALPDAAACTGRGLGRRTHSR
jgi:hypothetical protein